jgi:hypothetical protein
MLTRTSLRAPVAMTADDRIDRLAERIDRLTEQIGTLRAEVREEFGTVRVQIGDLRAEMIDRDANLLKWFLGFFVAQTAALGALMAAFR